MRIDAGAEKRHAVINGTEIALFRMECKSEIVFQKRFNAFNICLGFLVIFLFDHNEEIIDVAAVVLITEFETDETVELIEIDVGDELGGQIANDDTEAIIPRVEALFGR